jgi:AcrR family transcriptional regulator
MDALAEAAGMTHGSLYSQFDSKEHLAAEALGRAFDASAAKYGEIETLSAYVERYLSGHPRKRLRHCSTWLRGPSAGQCDAADLYGGTSTHDEEIDPFGGS